jgi:hypothetical protein
MNTDVARIIQARGHEPLHPDLVPYLEEDEFLGLCLKHPLVYDIPHLQMTAWRCNDQYATKRKALEKAMREHRWESVIWLHERPYRRNALWSIRRNLTDREYWKLVGMVWVDSENIWQWGNLTRQLVGSQRPGRRYIMDEEENVALTAMPDTLTIYRGLTSRGTRKGWAWTLDRARAEWFAHRTILKGEKPIVLAGTISKAHVIAYFTGRNEEEIVANPQHIKEGQ